MGYFSPQLIATFDEGDFGEQNWGRAARGMLGVENEDDAIKRISKNYNISDPEQREEFFAAIREVNPAEEMRLRKESIEFDTEVAAKEKYNMAKDDAVKGVANTMSNFIISEPLDRTYPLIIGTNWTEGGWKKGESDRFYKKIKAVEDTFANWLVSLRLTNTDVYKLQNDSDLRREYFERFAKESGTPFIEQIANLFKSGTRIEQTGNPLNINKNETSTKTNKDEVVTPESMGLNKDDFYFHKGKNMWYYKRGPNTGKPLNKRYQFNMTAADQENEVNSSLFGGTSYA